MKVKKITFFVMTQKGAHVLSEIIQNFGADIIDKVVGARDINLENDYFDVIKNTCASYGISFFERSEQPAVETRYAIAISWRWLIKMEDQRLIVLHDSLLPRYRGFAPLVNALINGDTTVGVTALFSGRGYDTGDILLQKKMDVIYPVKIQKLIDDICKVYAAVVLDVVALIINGAQIPSTVQDENLASYSLWLNEEDYFINWSEDASTIKRFIDSVGSPYAGARSFDGQSIYIFKDAVEEPEVNVENRHVGKVIFNKESEPVIVCGRGLLRITKMTDEQGVDVLPLKKFRTKFFTP